MCHRWTIIVAVFFIIVIVFFFFILAIFFFISVLVGLYSHGIALWGFSNLPMEEAIMSVGGALLVVEHL
jgi:hypothetical protein